jgi:lamin B
VTSAAPAGKTPLGQSIRESVYSIISANKSATNGHNGNSSTNGRSPVSPSRVSRLQEKEEMQNLNERLVIYIDTVRRLESENNRLQHTIQTYTENSVRDVADIKKLFETELEDAKRLIDELAREKARIEIEVNKYKAESEEALAKLVKRDREFRSLEDKFKNVESEALEFRKR